MVLRMRFALAFAFVFAGCSTDIRTTSYDRKCVSDTDCVAVYSGEVCNTCRCPNAAVSQKDADRYKKDLESILKACGTRAKVDCEPCNPTTGLCLGGTCTGLPQ